MEQSVRAVCGAVFIAAWYIGVVAIFYTVIETIAVISFASFVFASGKILVRIKEPLIVRPAALSAKGVTPHATFRLIGADRCLFRESGPGLLFMRFTGPFFLKGTMAFRDGHAVTIGRLAVGPSVLYVAFLTGWTAGGLGLLLQDGSSALGRVVLFLLLGWGILGVLAAVSIVFAKRYFYRSYSEVRAALQPTILL